MKKTAIALILISIPMFVISPTTMAADDDGKPIVSITPYLGYGFWSKDLGVDDSFMYGGRAAIHFLKWLSVEGTYGRSGTNHEVDGTGVDLDHYGVDLVAELLPRAKFVPYLTAGWAQLDYNAEGADRKEPLNGAEVGVGIKTRLGGNSANYRALRLDVRDVISDLNPSFPNNGANTHNIVASLGVQFAFGSGSKKDSDNDGIRDKNDQCADTPIGATIDAVGCPIDSDSDGVFDGLDMCDGTPARAKVGPDGCPIDSDGDGIFDGLDKCPDTIKNVKVDARGCPLVEPTVEIKTEYETFDQGSLFATTMVHFDVDSAVLDRKNTALLEGIGTVLADWPELKVEIGGHTDDTGSAAYNQTISEERAQEVRDHLKSSHPLIRSHQFRVKGYGESKPVADNGTEAGRAANRRVEFKVLNTEMLKREIKKR